MNPDIQNPPKKWPFSRKMTLILAGGLVALIILIVAIIMAVNGNKPEAENNSQATTYDRPGYDRAKLGDGVADPFAVKFTPDSSPVDYKGAKVVQACNVLTLDNLTEQGLKIKANTIPTPIARTVNDGVGQGEYAKTVYASSFTGKSLGSDVNSCSYVLEEDENSSTVIVNSLQPFAVPSDVIDEELQKNYTASGNIEGLELFTKKASKISSSDTTEYIAIERGKGAFYLLAELSGDQAAKKQPLLEAAAKNFVREQANPSGVAKLEYDSPIFNKDITRACDLITNDAVRSLSGRDAGPLAREGIAPSIAALTLPGDKTPHLNIRNECTRSTAGGGSGLGGDGPGDFSFKTETTSFLTDAPAKRAIEIFSQPNPNNKGNAELPAQVGDGGVAYTDASGGYHVVFVKGRVVADLSISPQSLRATQITSLQAAAEKLTPIAKTMAEKITTNEI